MLFSRASTDSSFREPDDPGHYVSLKIYVSGYTRGNEVAMYERINAVAAKTKHSGHEHIRKFITSFEVQGPYAKHTCIVQQALGITMDHLFPYLKNRSLTLDTVKPFLRQILFALDFLHTQAGIIHTGKPVTMSKAVDKNGSDLKTSSRPPAEKPAPPRELPILLPGIRRR